MHLPLKLLGNQAKQAIFNKEFVSYFTNELITTIYIKRDFKLGKSGISNVTVNDFGSYSKFMLTFVNVKMLLAHK